MKHILTVDKIQAIEASTDQGWCFDINVELEPWRLKDLICRLWSSFPNEFEQVIKSEGFELKEIERPPVDYGDDDLPF